jgi:hypothetical protein
LIINNFFKKIELIYNKALSPILLSNEFFLYNYFYNIFFKKKFLIFNFFFFDYVKLNVKRKNVMMGLMTNKNLEKIVDEHTLDFHIRFKLKINKKLGITSKFFSEYRILLDSFFFQKNFFINNYFLKNFFKYLKIKKLKNSVTSFIFLKKNLIEKKKKIFSLSN